MFDSLIAAAEASRHAEAVGAWARVENAACARRLAAMADELERMLAADGSDEREQWCLDNWDAVAASIAAAQNVSLGVAAHQLVVADDLRHRLPRVAEVFAAGAINYRLVSAVAARTRLIRDKDARAKVDTEIAAHLTGWGSLSVAKTEQAIDYWVDRFDPAAVRRTEDRSRGRHVDVHTPDDGSGSADITGQLLATDAEALDQRLDAMAGVVCEGDPRTHEQRRADALGAIGHGGDRLTCLCDDPQCAAAGTQPSTVVIHVVVDDESLSDDTPAQLDGRAEPGPTRAELLNMTLREALSEPPPPGPAATAPAALLGGGMLPAPLLAAKIAGTAKIVPIVHPGGAAPERRYIPSAVLAWFVRCRDMTCRFPGCDQPAQRCDIDHTIAHPTGPTQASNLKCLCRKHHLLKTFWGWHDQQLPDGTVHWRSPRGQRYTTHPGSRIQFPSLCRPTAPVCVPTNGAAAQPNRGLMMPRRKQARAQNRAAAIDDERRHNQTAIEAEAGQRSQNRERLKVPGTAWADAALAIRPRRLAHDDPPPF